MLTCYRVLIGWELECSISTTMVDTHHIVGIEKWIPITKVGKEYLVSTIIVDTYNIVGIDKEMSTCTTKVGKEYLVSTIIVDTYNIVGIDKEMSTCTTKVGKPITMANIEKKSIKKWGVIAKVGKKYLVSTTMANT